MWPRVELLKPIWHAFTALDLDHHGKVSKSQLKVLSYNLCTVMKIPHDLGVLEEHFKDDNTGPLSSQGYMPYLNRFILDKACRDFDMEEFNKMCWMVCYQKNIHTKHLLISDNDAFKVWCIFNFLSEDRYPLVIVIEEVEYFLRKLTEAMGVSWFKEEFIEYKRRLRTKSCLTGWELIELVGVGQFSRGVDRQTVSMGINEVFMELILDVVKQGYMLKKGHKRKNWTERWFVLRPSVLSYYICEDQVEKKGDIDLGEVCCVESLPDKEGKKCLFIVKCAEKNFEISVSEKRMKQEWLQAIQLCVHLLRSRQASPHRESRLRRRELRLRQQVEEEEERNEERKEVKKEELDDLAERMKQLQVANDSKQRELEAMRMKMEEASAKATLEELRRKKNQSDMHDRYRRDLESEKLVRQQMEEQVAQKSIELDQYLQRVHLLEQMYQQLQEALDDERQAKQDEEALRRLQASLLKEEAAKRAELQQLHLQQQSVLSQTEAEKQELMAEQLVKEKDLQEAKEHLERLESERRGALDQYEILSKKLERAATKTKTWKDKVAKQEGLLRLIQPGDKTPHLITNWGPASFTNSELELKKKTWQERKNQPAQAQ